MQLKVGPIKKITKTAAPVTAQPRIAAAVAAEKVSVSTAEPLVKLRDNVKDKLSMLKHIKVDSAALKVAVKKLDDKAKRVPLKDTAQVSRHSPPPLNFLTPTVFLLFSQNCTLYVGHLPHGLLEEQLKTYYS